MATAVNKKTKTSVTANVASRSASTKSASTAQRNDRNDDDDNDNNNNNNTNSSNNRDVDLDEDDVVVKTPVPSPVAFTRNDEGVYTKWSCTLCSQRGTLSGGSRSNGTRHLNPTSEYYCPNLQATKDDKQTLIQFSPTGANDDKVAPAPTYVDPIQFYRTGAGAKYSGLASIALEIFTIASGEAACERLFSRAGYFDADRRAFVPKTLTMLTMCKYYPEVK